jgi:hypothetical protein
MRVKHWMITAALSIFVVLWPAQAKTIAPKASAPKTAAEIIVAAHRAAGGALWLRPKTLHMVGQAVMYTDGDFGSRKVLDHYEMWREFPAWSGAAHAANGKVRIDAKSAGKVVFQIAFDGKNTYNQSGLQPAAKASAEWSEAFGFGIIRFALSEGFTQRRLADDLVDAKLCFVVLVSDAVASETTFWIDQTTHAIRKVGFDTPKGWHERVYSDFYSLSNGWMQPGRVRLSYRGRLSNDIVWKQTTVNEPIAAEVFVLRSDAN